MGGGHLEEANPSRRYTQLPRGGHLGEQAPPTDTLTFPKLPLTTQQQTLFSPSLS